MEVKRSGSQASTKGPSDWFTGTVRIDPLFQAPDPARVAGASVTFRAGGAYGVAYASARSDFDHYGRERLGAARGRAHRRNSPRRCCLVFSR